MRTPDPRTPSDAPASGEPGADLAEGLSTDPTPDPEPDLPGDEGVDAELGDDPGSGGD